jgi:hypothetical protein
MTLSGLFDFLCFLALTGLLFASYHDDGAAVYRRTLAAKQAIVAQVDAARATAGRYGGAVIAITTPAGGNTRLDTYWPEPSTGTTGSRVNRAFLGVPVAIGGISNGAIFIDSDGTLRLDASWSPWQAVVGWPAACTTSLSVTSTLPKAPSLGTIDCASTQ